MIDSGVHVLHPSHGISISFLHAAYPGGIFSANLLTGEQRVLKLGITRLYHETRSRSADGIGQMGSHLRSASLAALVVYFAAIVGGSLHHHAHAVHDARGQLPCGFAIQNDSEADECGECSLFCSICAAVAQAKAPPPAAAVVSYCTLVDQPVAEVLCLPPFHARVTTQARAPPTL
jgi:hypothetical protein